jgi:hypothetical protein
MFGSRLIFGSHFPFRVAQLRDARARGGKLSRDRSGQTGHSSSLMIARLYSDPPGNERPAASVSIGMRHALFRRRSGADQSILGLEENLHAIRQVIHNQARISNAEIY